MTCALLTPLVAVTLLLSFGGVVFLFLMWLNEEGDLEQVGTFCVITSCAYVICASFAILACGVEKGC